MHDDLASPRRSRRSPLALGLALLVALWCVGPAAATASAAAGSGQVAIEVGAPTADPALARPAEAHHPRRRARRLERVGRVFDPLWRRVASRAPARPRRPPRELPPPPSATVLPPTLRAPPTV